VLKEIATTHVESLVLSQAGRQAEGIEPEQQLSRMETLWKQTEAEIQKGRVLCAGISNIDTDLFVTLHQNAKVVKQFYFFSEQNNSHLNIFLGKAQYCSN
jgi:diketogulonate reductase-like aldo/keto reductase